MITIYTTGTCAYCKMVKQFLSLKGKEYKEINIDESPELRAEALSISGALSVPITTDGNSVVIGWNPSKLVSLV